jgi:hypothetical protein
VSKSWPLVVVGGMVLAAAAGAHAGGEGTEGGGRPAVSCQIASDSHELKLKNASSKATLASGKVVQVTYKYADGSVKTHDFRMSSALGAGNEINLRTPFEHTQGTTCSARIQ